MPRILKDLIINEVSSVDMGAGEGVKVLLMKRDNTGDTDMDPKALAELITKSVNDALATSSAAITKAVDSLSRDVTILKMSATHKAFYDDLKDEDAKKAFEAMDEKARDEECAKTKKRADVVTGDDLSKRDADMAELRKSNEALQKRLDAVDLEKAQADFKKRAADIGLTQDGDGEIMRKAYAGDKEAQASFEKRQKEVADALRAQAETGGLFKTFGSHEGAANGNAIAKINAKAEELRKTADGSKLSPQQAFTKVYTDPANASLVAEYKSEEARGRAQVVA